jgi:hypothetical protein
MADALVVVSKVKAMVSDAGLRTGADFVEALSAKVGQIVGQSIEKVQKEGGKKTLGAEDLS